jgi:hypothetical protein
MPQNVGQLAEATHYNSVAEDVNLVFGDKYSTAVVTEPNRIATHKYGWGGGNIAENLAVGTTVTAARLQDLVERTNVTRDRTPLPDSILFFQVPTNRNDVSANTPIRAEDLNLVEENFNTVLLNNNHLIVDAADASNFTATPTFPLQRTTQWQNKLNGENKWTFSSYNHARYFFNSGGILSGALAMSGGSTAGYYNWADVINEMGTLNLTWDNVFESNATTGGTSEGKGFYDLTEYYGDGTDAGATDEGLLYSSSGVTISGYGYGYGYGYGGATYHGYITGQGNHPSYTSSTPYSNIFLSSYSQYSAYQNLKFKLYGKYAANGSEVHLKWVLDDTTFDQIIDGTIIGSFSYLMPDVMTYGNATFDVTPNPTIEVTNNFTSADDS